MCVCVMQVIKCSYANKKKFNKLKKQNKTKTNEMFEGISCLNQIAINFLQYILHFLIHFKFQLIYNLNFNINLLFKL